MVILSKIGARAECIQSNGKFVNLSCKLPKNGRWGLGRHLEFRKHDGSEVLENADLAHGIPCIN